MMQYQLMQSFGENLVDLTKRVQQHSMSPMQIDVTLHQGLTPFHQAPVVLNGQMFLDMSAMLMAFAQPSMKKPDLPSLTDIQKGNI